MEAPFHREEPTMNKPYIATAGSALRQHLIDDMTLRGFGEKTQRDYIRIVSRFAAFLGRSPASTTAEDIRRFQLEQREAGMNAPAMNSHVAALRFFFTTTLDRPDLSRKLIRIPYPRKLPTVLSPEEVARLLAATTCAKQRAALGAAYGAGLRVAEGAAAAFTRPTATSRRSLMEISDGSLRPFADSHRRPRGRAADWAPYGPGIIRAARSRANRSKNASSVA
jgi:site-specific recombinase XerD